MEGAAPPLILVIPMMDIFTNQKCCTVTIRFQLGVNYGIVYTIYVSAFPTLVEELLPE